MPAGRAFRSGAFPAWARRAFRAGSSGVLLGAALVVAGFAASRALAWHLGVRFDAAPLDYFWQFLDPTLLRDDLAGSLLHLHSQPPGFNALLGLVLKLTDDPGLAFARLYHAIGLATALGLFGVLVRLGAQPLRAAAAVVVFAASPTFVLYESWLFYTHVVAALLVAGVWLVQSLLSHARARDAAGLSGVLAALACTRSLFHLVWMVGVLSGVLWLVRRQRSSRRTARLALAMAPALLLVVALHAKNAIVFGSPASSTWLGMSLAKLTTERLPAELRERLVREGELSPAALVRPFSPLWKYPKDLTRTRYHGHPALDRVVKPGNYTNFNNGAYVELNRLYLRDALYTIRHDPGVYLTGIGRGLLLYCIPPSQYRFLGANRAAYGPVERVFDRLTGVPEAFLGHRAAEAFGDPSYLVRRVRWIYLAALLAAMGWAGLRCRRLPSDPRSDAERGVLLFCLANALWVGLVANALELGENQRFQAMVAPLHLLLIAWMAEQGVQRWLRRRTPEGVATEGAGGSP